MIFYIFCILTGAKYIIPKALASFSADSLGCSEENSENKIKTQNLYEKSNQIKTKSLKTFIRPKVIPISNTKNVSEIQSKRNIRFLNSSQPQIILKKTIQSRENNELTLSNKLISNNLTEIIKDKKNFDLNQKTIFSQKEDLNETETDIEDVDETDSTYSVLNELVNSQYYIYILAIIILLSAIIIIYISYQCCNKIQKCLEDNEAHQPLNQSTDESDYGFVSLN